MRIVVQGSYNTSNVGDRAIGQVLKDKLTTLGHSVTLNGTIDSRYENIPNFKKYDYHIIGGGGVLRDYPYDYLRARLEPIKTVKKKSFVLSAGFVGLRTKRGMEQIKLLDECEFITVRDKKSKELLQPYLNKPVEVAACPTYLLNTGMQQQGRKIIGINLRDYGEGENRWGEYLYFPEKVNLVEKRQLFHRYIKETLVPNLRSLSKEYELMFIPFAGKDITFAKKHLKNLPIKILPWQEPEETLQIIASVEKMICMRYHSIIFSILAQKPLFAISYENKTKELLSMLNISHVELNNFKNTRINFSVPSHFAKIKQDMINSANLNFQKLRRILE